MKYDSCHDAGTGSFRSDDAGVHSRCPVSQTCGPVHDPGYRNLFGPAEPWEQYQGAGSEAATRKLLLRLTKSMRRAGTTDESQIPAGYTYLAQLAAHDLVHNPTRVPNLFDGLTARHDLRAERLMLETLYGGGPVACPQLFHREHLLGNVDRSRLRLLYVYDEEQDGSAAGAENVRKTVADMRTGKHDQAGAYRDLPRVVLDDGPSNQPSFTSHGDVLLADARNDDHLIIAQLTVIFALLHNLFDEYLRSKKGLSGRERFIRARKATTYVYRRIIFLDLLPRLLHPFVLEAFRDRGFRLEQHSDSRMNVEFAHAAFRAGHSMVRAAYPLNEKRTRAPLAEILERRSIITPLKSVPHSGDWLVAWSRFFTFAGSDAPQMAARISPSVQQDLIDDLVFQDSQIGQGGLLYADLLRGAFSGLRSVDSLIEAMSAAGLPGYRALCRENWEPMLEHWLESRKQDSQLTAHDVACLLQDPPLLLFVMHEAMLGSPKHAFGLMGSVIVAETFFAIRDRTEHLIELDEATLRLVADLFGESKASDVGPLGAGPADMPSLIKDLAQRLGYVDLTCPFI